MENIGIWARLEYLATCKIFLFVNILGLFHPAIVSIVSIVLVSVWPELPAALIFSNGIANMTLPDVYKGAKAVMLL